MQSSHEVAPGVAWLRTMIVNVVFAILMRAPTIQGRKIMDLPAGGYNNHWTRNLIASADGKKLYISVGSASNVAELGTDKELLRANILEVNPDGTGLRVFAAGLRNPVGAGPEHYF